MRKLTDNNNKTYNPIDYHKKSAKNYPIALFNDNEKQWLLNIKNNLSPKKQIIINILLDSNENLERADAISSRYNLSSWYVYYVIKKWNKYGPSMFIA